MFVQIDCPVIEVSINVRFFDRNEAFEGYFSEKLN